MGVAKKAKHEAKAAKSKTKKDADKVKHEGKKVKNAAKHRPCPGAEKDLRTRPETPSVTARHRQRPLARCGRIRHAC